MIITEQKSFDTIISQSQQKSVFIIGCNECASICHTGGDPEVLEMKKRLEEYGVTVTGGIVLDPACHLLNDKRLLKTAKEKIDSASFLLVLSCGNGVQVIRELFPDKDIISGTNTLFLGAEKKRGTFSQECLLCGSCNSDEFDAGCPIAHCPKQMLNGPCGGSMNGSCEVDPSLECIWDTIIKKKKELNTMDSLKSIVPPKDWTQYRNYHWRSHEKQ